MEIRKIFDTIPKQFDQYRPRYTPALFDDLIRYAEISSDSHVLEIGPGTGQATAPILDTGCAYHAIELGENLCAAMQEKFGERHNFDIVCDDFITYDFGTQRFDMIYAAATIQWMPEEIAFAKTFSLLKPGGTLAMMLTKSDYKKPNQALYEQIQKLYERYWDAKTYPHRGFAYTSAPNYGYVGFEKREYQGVRVMTADEYVGYCGTHCDHIVIPEPKKSAFFAGLREAVLAAGDQIIFHDTYVLYLAKKPSGGADA